MNFWKEPLALSAPNPWEKSAPSRRAIAWLPCIFPVISALLVTFASAQEAGYRTVTENVESKASAALPMSQTTEWLAAS